MTVRQPKLFNVFLVLACLLAGAGWYIYFYFPSNSIYTAFSAITFLPASKVAKPVAPLEQVPLPPPATEKIPEDSLKPPPSEAADAQVEAQQVALSATEAVPVLPDPKEQEIVAPSTQDSPMGELLGSLNSKTRLSKRMKTRKEYYLASNAMVDELIPFLDSKDPTLALECADILTTTNRQKAVQPLFKRIQREKNIEVKRQLLDHFNRFYHPEAGQLINRAYLESTDANSDLQKLYLKVLPGRVSSALQKILLEQLGKTKDGELERKIYVALASFGVKKVAYLCPISFGGCK